MGKIDHNTPSRELVDVESFDPILKLPDNEEEWEIVHLKGDSKGDIPVIRYIGDKAPPQLRGAIVFPAGIQAVKPKTHIKTWENMSPVAFTKEGHKLEINNDESEGWAKFFQFWKEANYPHERLGSRFM
jgi:hypothetical protein